MSDESMSRLERWLKRTKGDDLRVVGRYTSDSIEWIYRRDDVVDEYDESDFEESVVTYREFAPLIDRQSDIIHGGRHRATVNVYDDLILLQFPLDEETGVISSFESTVGDDLVDVVASGLQLLMQDEQNRLPEWTRQRRG